MEKMKMFLHKICGTTPESDLQPKEILSYSIAGFGQNLICTFISSFLMLFLTDTMKLGPMFLAWLFLGVRLFDAFNDPIMGTIVDYTNTKNGKLRPYLKWTPIPIAIMTILCFTNIPGMTINAKMIYIGVIYTIWSVVYTVVDVPYWGLSTAMTSDTNLRNLMLTIARLLCTLGSGLVTVLFPIIIDSVKKYNDPDLAVYNPEKYIQMSSKIFLIFAIAISVVSIPLFYLGYKNTKERFYSEVKPKSLPHNLSLLFKNKPLMLIVLSGVLGSARYLYLSSGIYYAKYTLGSESLFSIITLLVAPGGGLASILTPYLSKKFGKKNLFIYSHIVGGILLLILYFIGFKTNGKTTGTYVFGVITLILAGIPSGFANILSYAMIADTVDYLEDKVGERAEGICFAMQTFISKVGMAVCAFAILLGLGAASYEPNVEATDKTLRTLWLLSALLPALSNIACAIPLFFYKFTEDQQRAAVARVAERKAQSANLKEQVEAMTVA